MAKEIAQRLEPDPAAQQGHGVRVPEAVGAMERDRQAAAPDPLLKDVAHGGGLEDPGRGPLPQKQLAIRRRRPAPTQVSKKDRPGRIREGKDQRGPGFTRGHVQLAAAPGLII